MKRSLLIGMTVTVMVAIGMFQGISFAQENQVQVKVSGPAGMAARPDKDTANVEFTFGQVQNGSAHLLLHSPAKKLFPSTDFPWVEDTDLIDSTVSIVDGKASFDYMFPIRGDYPMTVELMDNNGNKLDSQQLLVTIEENPKEIRNAIFFVALLAAFGLITGFGLAKRRRTTYAA